MKNTCCFTGHRLIPAADYRRIYYKTKMEIQKLAKEGVNKFICGGAVGYDMLCGELVLLVKKEIPDIKLIMAIPCENQQKKYSAADKLRYERLVREASEVVLLSKEYSPGCYHARNRYMVDNSSYIIAYCIKNSGGSYYTLGYAKKKGVEIVNNE